MAYHLTVPFGIKLITKELLGLTKFLQCRYKTGDCGYISIFFLLDCSDLKKLQKTKKEILKKRFASFQYFVHTGII